MKDDDEVIVPLKLVLANEVVAVIEDDARVDAAAGEEPGHEIIVDAEDAVQVVDWAFFIPENQPQVLELERTAGDREFSEYSFDDAELEEGPVNEVAISLASLLISTTGCTRNLLNDHNF